MKLGNLTLRADAGPTLGTGHVMRCMALAQAWQKAGGRAVMLSASISSALIDQLRASGIEGIRVEAEPGGAADAAQTIDATTRKGGSWVVIDGYHFGADYQKAVNEAGLCLLSIDDYGHVEHQSADIVLNQNVYAHQRLYKSFNSHCPFLLGPRFALLRQEFHAWRLWKREIPSVGRKVLVTLGGADPDNVTLKVMRALERVSHAPLEVKLVCGAANSHRALLEEAVKTSRHRVQVVTHAENIADLMAWADCAISASGTTTLEICFMQLPSLLIILSENQERIASGMAEMDTAWNLGWHFDVTEEEIASRLKDLLKSVETRREMSLRGRALVDGRGADRVAGEIAAGGVTLRKAEPDDCRLTWEWANDPETRAMSLNPEPIPWPDHVRWFASKLKDPSCVIYIAHNGSSEIGQVRFEIEDREARISIVVDPRYRGCGHGTETIRFSTAELFHSPDVESVCAFAKPGNVASIRSFEKAGFKNLGKTFVSGHEVVRLALERNS